jgi:hypothetical protein
MAVLNRYFRLLTQVSLISILTFFFAQVVELVDTTDLGSVTHKVCRFESYPGQIKEALASFFLLRK